jgi:hypothetical protein
VQAETASASNGTANRKTRTGAILAKDVNSDARFEDPTKRWPLPSPLLKIIELPFKTNEVGK